MLIFGQNPNKTLLKSAGPSRSLAVRTPMIHQSTFCCVVRVFFSSLVFATHFCLFTSSLCVETDDGSRKFKTNSPANLTTKQRIFLCVEGVFVTIISVVMVFSILFGRFKFIFEQFFFVCIVLCLINTFFLCVRN